MQNYEATEQAYKNGYEKGYADGKKDSAVHGRWDKYRDDRFIGYDTKGRIQYRYVYSYYCNKCGLPAAKKYDYCPNCGAKMDGGNEDA